MFHRALVALKLSSAAEAFLQHLVWVEHLGTREMVLAHVVEPDGLTPELAHARLRALGGPLHSQGFGWSQKLAEGNPGKELLRLAREVRASYVVMGSRSRREGHEGRVALDLLRGSVVPVLLEPLLPGAPAAPPPERILVPTDFSPSAAAAFRWVEGAVAAGFRKVDLLHVIEAGATGRSEAEAELTRCAERLRGVGATEVYSRVLTGSPARTIRAAALEAPRPLVVMGSQGRGFLTRTLLGSVSGEVARTVEAPLLLVPRP